MKLLFIYEVSVFKLVIQGNAKLRACNDNWFLVQGIGLGLGFRIGFFRRTHRHQRSEANTIRPYQNVSTNH